MEEPKGPNIVKIGDDFYMSEKLIKYYSNVMISELETRIKSDSFEAEMLESMKEGINTLSLFIEQECYRAYTEIEIKKLGFKSDVNVDIFQMKKVENDPI